MSKKQPKVKRIEPFVPVGHPEFVWRSGADVQATWRKYGWVPPSGVDAPPLVVDSKTPEWMPKQVRRVK